ncbi:MAG TPA: aminotransferase class V-fold PLP-dependent enzyme [Polyangiaceae bacterium]
MRTLRLLERALAPLPTGVLEWAFRQGRRIPGVGALIDGELERTLEPALRSLRPYRDAVPTFTKLPERGIAREEALELVRFMSEAEETGWRDGYASGAVYQGDPEHIEFMNRVTALASQANPLHTELWPSSSKFEAEIVAMASAMLGGASGTNGSGTSVGGSVSSGGTESIVLAMKAYRDYGRATHGPKTLRVVAPASAHPAFDKAADLLGLDLVRVPVGADYRADVLAMAAAVTPETVTLVGSAPSFPHGVIDPIAPLSELAQRFRIGLHVDACLGGFVLPFAKKLGYAVPDFDFRLTGVTSMSADTHKYGYAPKGSSVVLYRDPELRRAQYFVTTDWSGGIYGSPTIAGSRNGGLLAGCWASLVSFGEEGYLEATRSILETARHIRLGIAEIPELSVLGEPLWVIAFASDTLDIYRVLERMSERGWSLNGLQRPPAVHLCVTLRHTQPGVADRFLADLKASVAEARGTSASSGMAPLYGMASSFPVRGAVAELLRRYIDRLHRP